MWIVFLRLKDAGTRDPSKWLFFLTQGVVGQRQTVDVVCVFKEHLENILRPYRHYFNSCLAKYLYIFILDINLC